MSDFKSINPIDETVVGEYNALTDSEVMSKLKKSQEAFELWKEVPLEERGEYILRVAQVLESKKQKAAELMTKEMGKPISQGYAEIEKCGWALKYYVESAPAMLADEHIQTDAKSSFVHFDPLGSILAVMPWNFPFWQVYRGFAPGLMAGNVMVLKHASNVTGCGYLMQEIADEANLPEGVFQFLPITIPQIKDAIQSPYIQAVALTGSTPAGKSVAQIAGEVLKKTVLELGGSDPYIILEDADLQRAAKLCAQSRLINAGQSCVAAKRFIVIDSVKDKFQELLAKEMQSFMVGDPMNEKVRVGPLARVDLRDSLHQQVADSVEKGAKILIGGQKPDGPGAYYPPTLLTDVTEGMPAYHEELFGPVASIIAAQNEAEAIEIANNSIFGLGSGIFTADEERGLRIAKDKIDAGSCFVNDFVKSDPRLPFGGIKESGYGRELGVYGIREFVNTKTIYLAK